MYDRYVFVTGKLYELGYWYIFVTSKPYEMVAGRYLLLASHATGVPVPYGYR
jgi:hypothetical protein